MATQYAIFTATTNWQFFTNVLPNRDENNGHIRICLSFVMRLDYIVSLISISEQRDQFILHFNETATVYKDPLMEQIHTLWLIKIIACDIPVEHI